MKFKMFTIYDSKAETYSSIMLQNTTASFMRGFANEVQKPESTYHMYPADFTLFEIGEYDDQTGQVQAYQAKKSLGLALDFLQESMKTDQKGN